MDKDLEKKIIDGIAPLKDKSVIVAFSGGLDSTVVAFLVQKTCKKIKLVTVYSEWISNAEIEEAKEIANQLKIDHDILEITIEVEQHFWDNRPDRCYHCKLLIFSHLLDYARHNGYDIVIDGTNASDVTGHRPGLKALEKLGVISPLLNGKITKEEVRLIAEQHKLSVATKPAMACLASRVPYGERITSEKLLRIEQGEKILREMEISDQVRLRDHDKVARIEIDPKDFSSLLEDGLITKIVKELKILGYIYVTMDLEGYRPSIPEIDDD